MARRAMAPAREAELAALWAAGVWRGATLRTLSGAAYRLIFEGRRNGGPGPDFRDAALEMEDGARLLGDIELHLRARDWLAHGHHTDDRYNRVVLHVALDAVDAFSPLSNGGGAPIVCLSFTQAPPAAPPLWPCAHLHARIGPVAMRTLLLWAGSERFERRVHALKAALSCVAPDANASCLETGWSAADRVLWVALAEAIGYGQHREALRAAGMRLLSGDSLDITAASRSESRRLNGLLALWERWRATGPWRPLRATLMAEPRAIIAALHITGGVISPARARIMAANVVLPFATAWAIASGEPALAERAHTAYLELPGLPPNQITREMARQLALVARPAGAAAQQGLHHLWANWCCAKACARCPCNLSRTARKTL